MEYENNTFPAKERLVPELLTYKTDYQITLYKQHDSIKPYPQLCNRWGLRLDK